MRLKGMILFSLLACLTVAPSSSQEHSSTNAPKPLLLSEYNQKSDLEKKLAEYQKKPDDQDLFYLNCQYYLKYGSKKTCDKLSRDAIQKHPDWPAPYIMLGRLAEDSMEDDEALKDYQKALSLSPNCLNALQYYGNCLGLDTKHEECLAVIDRALKLFADHPKELPPASTWSCKLGLLRIKSENLMLLHRNKEAIAAMEESLRTFPDNPLALLDLTKACLIDGQYAKALNTVNLLIQKESKGKETYLLRAKAYAGLKQNEKAIADINTFFKNTPPVDALKPTLTEARQLRANLYDATGRKKEAAADRAVLKEKMGTIYQSVPFRSGAPK